MQSRPSPLQPGIFVGTLLTFLMAVGACSTLRCKDEQASKSPTCTVRFKQLVGNREAQVFLTEAIVVGALADRVAGRRAGSNFQYLSPAGLPFDAATLSGKELTVQLPLGELKSTPIENGVATLKTPGGGGYAFTYEPANCAAEDAALGIVALFKEQEADGLSAAAMP